MENDMATKIAANPKYQKLVRTRSSFGWILTAIMMFVYYATSRSSPSTRNRSPPAWARA